METLSRQGSRYARSLIEASLDPLFTINPEGKITDINNASINITEVTREKLIGTDFFEYFTEPNKAREIYKQVFAEGFVADFPLTIRDGKLTEVLFNGSVYKDEFGKVLGVVVVARDITDHKKIEKELTEAKFHAELATKIAEEAKAKAEKAAQIAEAAVKSKQQFLSNMSHEIRTPMNAIIGFTKVLLKTGLTDKQKEYLTAIKMSGDVLIVLINDILDLAKVDAGKMIFEQNPFKISVSMSVVIQLFEPKILEKNLTLIKNYDKNIPQVLVGDPLRLHQILINLVSNAVKFTTNGKITVGFKLLHEDKRKATIEFSVVDTGIGIEEDKLGQIFDNFQQASSKTGRLYGGTGLGLAIVKQLVEAQGGSITVQSRYGKGSVFSFVLHFMKTKEKVKSTTETRELNFDIKNLKILMVEDIPINQLLMKTILDDFGCENDMAGNGKIAIEKLQNKPYDLILMDLQMPEMDGFEATRYIRNTLKSNIPIIALTADVTTVDLKKCNAIGMNDYISKPVDERKLQHKIIEVLRKHSLIKVRKNKKQKAKHPLGHPVVSKFIDLTYLRERTKSNPKLMMEMIGLYLNQTPPLLGQMKQGVDNKDSKTLYTAVHTLIPSFSIMGIHKDYENMAKEIQELAHHHEKFVELKELVIQVENVCNLVCGELEKAYHQIKDESNA